VNALDIRSTHRRNEAVVTSFVTNRSDE